MAKDSRWYSCFRWYMMRCLDIFYREIKSSGSDKIPKGKPIIFASNHTNALMDPLVISYHSGVQHYFMTRGDVFRIKWIAAIFRSWRMLPIFRIKDGMETLSQNNPIMEFVTDRLKQGYSIIIFPEASHFWEQTVQPLKKGMARLAFDVAEQQADSELVIVPVGLHYNDMIRVNQDVLVNFGDPIRVKDLPQEENMQKSYLHLNRVVREKMMELVVCIKKTDLYDAKDQLRRELQYRLRHNDIVAVFAMEKSFMTILEEVEEKGGLTHETSLEEVLGQPEFSSFLPEYHSLHPKGYQDSLFLEFVKSPLYLLAYINNIPLVIICRLILGKVADRTFHSSIKFGLALIVNPLLVILQAALLGWALNSIYASLAYAVASPAFSVILADFLGKRNYKF